ncbi:MAG: hypothetical protein JSW11_20095 [Candidatus Heimdallarchaeota archaeon]|nr:MAG: hypothetical protein JSW11_20095 [Candidatus Heimdallarchaeota archaeon]
MPRKRLMISDKENSPRFNFRMDEEVKNILLQTKDKSRFVREAIVYYWEHVGNRDFRSTEFIPKEEPVEPRKPESGRSSTWKAPWLSS